MIPHPAFSSAMADEFSWPAHVRRMLEVEAELSRVQAEIGLIPEDAAEEIARACGAGIDAEELAGAAAAAATPVIPLVSRLRAAVGEPAARFVHFGSTSQDILDTALVLQARAGVDRLSEELLGLGGACARLADEHRGTLMVGRTLLQQAVPITFGLKAAHWLAMVTRNLGRLRDLRGRLPLQCGGAAGTLAAFRGHGEEIAEGLARRLGLRSPDLPWHTERDVVGEIACTVGLVATGCGKLARDVALLMQDEVGEVADPGAGGSSTMPHKQNPVDPAFAVAAATLAAAAVAVVVQAGLQEHERAVGGWQAEWVAVPDVFHHTFTATERVRRTVERLRADPDRMRANLGLTRGQVMLESLVLALARRVGREEAERIVSDVSDRARENRQVREVAAEDERVTRQLSVAELDELLDPAAYLGSAEVFVERALAGWEEVARSAAAGRSNA